MSQQEQDLPKPPCKSDRRTFLAVALAGLSAAGVSCGGGSDGAAATPASAASASTDDDSPSRDAGEPSPSVAPERTFAEPTSAADYLAKMQLGIQAGDYLELFSEARGRLNAVNEADYNVMVDEGKFDHVRIPANCAARASAAGMVTETFMLTLDQHIAWTMARFERVILDPLHHYQQWTGEHGSDTLNDDSATASLTSAEHAVRACAIWTQIAQRYKNVSARLSFDLVNEPRQVAQQAGYPSGMTADDLNQWYASVVPAIRATGGNNVHRMLWLEPWNGQLERLTLPPDAGSIGVSPHFYTPFPFTHQSARLTSAGLANFEEDLRFALRWGQIQEVPVWIGESGVSIMTAGTWLPSMPRSTQERAEYIAHVRNTAIDLRIPACLWSYNSNFGLYDQSAGAWLPSMRQAVTGLPAPLAVRERPDFILLRGGRMARLQDPSRSWRGFTYDPETGILSAPVNNTGYNQTVLLVFPDIPVQGGQSWIARARAFSGHWALGNCPVSADPEQLDIHGVAGVDTRATNPSGQVIYPGYRAQAPGGFDNLYEDIQSPHPFFAIDVQMLVGSPAGSISFECVRSI